jgi:hypothetical protein
VQRRHGHHLDSDFSSSVYRLGCGKQYYAECVKGGADKHAKNRHRFPSPSLGSYSRPLTVVDIRGRIVLWYIYQDYYQLGSRCDGISPTIHQNLTNCTGSIAPRDPEHHPPAAGIHQEKGCRETHSKPADIQEELCYPTGGTNLRTQCCHIFCRLVCTSTQCMHLSLVNNCIFTHQIYRQRYIL